MNARLAVSCALTLAIGAAGCASRPAAVAIPQPAPAVAPTPIQQLATRISALVSGPGVARGTWGIAVHSLARNERLFERNAHSLLVPASSAKIIALAAAADAVGWNHAYDTTIMASGPVDGGVLRGDLVIVGSGDPGFGGRGDADFELWIDALKTAGIRKIDGRIIGNDNAFEDPRPGAMWGWDDLGYRTGALYGALNYSENVMRVTVTPGAAPSSPVTLSVEPHAEMRPLANRAVTGALGSMQLLWPEQRPGEPSLTIAGSIPVGAPPAQMIVSAGNPTLWFANVLRSRLLQEGIEVTGDAFDIDDVLAGPESLKGAVLYTYRSKPLSEQALLLMKESVNLYAEAVFRLSTGPGGGRTNDEAIAGVKARLPFWGLSDEGWQQVDGSGLSRRDTVSADLLVAVLRRMFDPLTTSPWMRAFPIGGVDGTLDARLKGTAAEGNVRAKTGTMSNIRSLAGYVTTRDGEPLAFAIMVNNFEGTGAQANTAIDSIAVALAEFSRQR